MWLDHRLARLTGTIVSSIDLSWASFHAQYSLSANKKISNQIQLLEKNKKIVPLFPNIPQKPWVCLGVTI